MSSKKQAKQFNKSRPINCAYCRGQGVDPFGIPSKLSRCQVCQGRKTNLISDPFEKCTACGGRGTFKHHRLSCSVCKGRGQVPYIQGKDRKAGCRPENADLPCISSYDFS